MIGLLSAHRFTLDTNCDWAVWSSTDTRAAHGRRTITLDPMWNPQSCFRHQVACVSPGVSGWALAGQNCIVAGPGIKVGVDLPADLVSSNVILNGFFIL